LSIVRSCQLLALGQAKVLEDCFQIALATVILKERDSVEGHRGRHFMEPSQKRAMCHAF